MSFIRVFIIFFINFILQTTVFNYFRIFGVVSNTTLVLLIVFSILLNNNYALISGCIIGLMYDIMFGQAIGINTLLYFLIGYLISWCQRIVYKDNIITPIFFALSATIFYHLGYYIFMNIINNSIELLYLLKNIVILETIYNIIIIFPVYKFVYWYINYSKIKIRIR